MRGNVMTETTKAYKEIKKGIKIVVGSIGDFYENTTKQGEAVGNCTLYESGDVIDNGDSVKFSDTKYRLVFYGDKKCCIAKAKLKKGMTIRASGPYREYQYKDQNNNDRMANSIIVEQIEIVTKGGNKND